MATAVEQDVIREDAPCSWCKKPRTTLMVPAEQAPHGHTMTVTLCAFCDGGVEWKPLVAPSEAQS